MGLPKRKKMRLNNFDYSQNGKYFITICVKERHELLGKIVGDGVLDVPRNQLSEYGAIVEKYINAIDKTYENISVDKYIIMPNHIHMILFVSDSKSGTSRTPSPTNAVIPSIISTFKRFANKEYGVSLFQRSYYDHIIRNEKEYLKIWQYIDTNPQTWQNDCFYHNVNECAG